MKMCSFDTDTWPTNSTRTLSPTKHDMGNTMLQRSST